MKPRRKFAEELQTLKGQILAKKRKGEKAFKICSIYLKWGSRSWLCFELFFTLHVALKFFFYYYFSVNVILLCLLIMLKYWSVGAHLLSAWTQWIPCLQVLTTERSAHSAYCLVNLLNSQHVRTHRLVQDETNSSKISGKLQCPMSEEHACTRVWILVNFSPFWCFVQFRFAHNRSVLLCPVYWLYYIKTLKREKIILRIRRWRDFTL